MSMRFDDTVHVDRQDDGTLSIIHRCRKDVRTSRGIMVTTILDPREYGLGKIICTECMKEAVPA